MERNGLETGSIPFCFLIAFVRLALNDYIWYQASIVPIYEALGAWHHQNTILNVRLIAWIRSRNESGCLQLLRRRD